MPLSASDSCVCLLHLSVSSINSSPALDDSSLLMVSLSVILSLRFCFTKSSSVFLPFFPFFQSLVFFLWVCSDSSSLYNQLSCFFCNFNAIDSWLVFFLFSSFLTLSYLVFTTIVLKNIISIASSWPWCLFRSTHDALSCNTWSGYRIIDSCLCRHPHLLLS